MFSRFLKYIVRLFMSFYLQIIETKILNKKLICTELILLHVEIVAIVMVQYLRQYSNQKTKRIYTCSQWISR